MIRVIRVISIVGFIASAVIYFGVSFKTGSNIDRRGPEIKISEKEITVSVAASPEEMLKGIEAKDKKDGDVTESIVIESLGNFIEKGKREVKVAAFDSDNNVTKAVRTINYSDYSSPRIKMTSPLRASITDKEKLTEGITVTDCLEGDITENLQITFAENTSGVVATGTYPMKMTVISGAGDTVEIPVTAEFYDAAQESMRPGILLSEYLVYTKKGQTINPLQYLKGLKIRNQEYYWEAQNWEQRPSVGKERVKISNNVDYNTPGVYEIIYTVDTVNSYTGSVRQIVIVEE